MIAVETPFSFVGLSLEALFFRFTWMLQKWCRECLLVYLSAFKFAAPLVLLNKDHSECGMNLFFKNSAAVSYDIQQRAALSMTCPPSLVKTAKHDQILQFIWSPAGLISLCLSWQSIILFFLFIWNSKKWTLLTCLMLFIPTGSRLSYFSKEKINSPHALFPKIFGTDPQE